MCPTNQPKRRTLGFTRKCSSLPERLDEEDGKDDEEVAEDGGQDQDQHQDQQRRRDHVAAAHKVTTVRLPVRMMSIQPSAGGRVSFLFQHYGFWKERKYYLYLHIWNTGCELAIRI